MRRVLLIATLPLVWVPLIGLLLTFRLPWYALLFGIVFWVYIARRRAARDQMPPVEGGAAFSPLHRAGGGLW